MYKILKRAFPQCGSDGRTYQNLCLLNCAKMRCPEQTAGVTARAGECDQADQKQGFHDEFFLKQAQSSQTWQSLLVLLSFKKNSVIHPAANYQEHIKMINLVFNPHYPRCGTYVCLILVFYSSDKTEVLDLPSGCFQGCECPKWLDYQVAFNCPTYF